MDLARMIGIAALALALLAGCDDGGDYPALMPTDRILAPPALPGHAGDAANDPAAATEALQTRGRALAGRGGDGGVADAADLERRAEALRTRARALSQRPLDSCPEDDPDCAATPQQEPGP